MGVSHLIIEKCIYLFGFDKFSVVIGLSSVDSPISCWTELLYQRTRRKTHTEGTAKCSQMLTQQTMHLCPRKINKSISLPRHDVYFVKKSLYVSNRDSNTNYGCLTNSLSRNTQIVEFIKIHLSAYNCQNTQISPQS